MKQKKLIYAFIILSVTFLLIYINKKVFLEGLPYTYNKDLTFNSTKLTNNTYAEPTGLLPMISGPSVRESTCKTQCDTNPLCRGFTTNIIDTPDDSGVGNCKFYNRNSNLTTDTRISIGTNLYTKIYNI